MEKGQFDFYFVRYLLRHWLHLLKRSQGLS